MSGEMPKSKTDRFQKFHYRTTEENEEKVRRARESIAWKEESYQDMVRASRKKAIPIKVNGRQYQSVEQASQHLGMSDKTLRKYQKQFMASGRSEIEFEAKVKMTFTIQRNDHG